MVNKVWEWVRTDGLLHICVSALILEVLDVFFPLWVAVVLTVIIGSLKELRDYTTQLGTAEWHDGICDAIGILLGVLLRII